MNDGLESHYDCVIVGTSLVQAIVSGALSKIGKKVLHIDKNDFYGGLDHSTHNLRQFLSLCLPDRVGREAEIDVDDSHSGDCDLQPQQTQSVHPYSKAHESFQVIDFSPSLLQPGCMTEKVTLCRRPTEGSPACYGYAMHKETHPTEKFCDPTVVHPSFFGYQADHKWTVPRLLDKSRNFNVDLHPRLLLSSGKLVDAIVASGVGNYLEFKSLESLYYLVSSTTLASPPLALARVPTSKADIFNTTMFSALEKRSLMKIIQYAVDYGRETQGIQVDTLNENELASGRALLRPQNKDSSKGLDSVHQRVQQDPLRPFRDFLKDSGVSPKLAPFITHGIGLESDESCTSVSALESMYRHISSSGRYGETSFLTPVYGTSEFAQAFCRLSAVWGTVFVLRYDITELFLQSPPHPSEQQQEKDGAEDAAIPRGEERPADPNHITAVRITGGKVVSCDFLVADRGLWPLPSFPCNPRRQGLRLVQRHMILDRSILLDPKEARGLIIIPPHTQGVDNSHAVFAMQLDSSTSVSTGGTYMLYLSTYIVTSRTEAGVIDSERDRTVAKDVMSRAYSALCEASKRGGEVAAEELLFITLLHSCEDNEAEISTPSSLPDNLLQVDSSTEHLLYIHSCVVQAERIFHTICPGEVFLVDRQELQVGQGEGERANDPLATSDPEAESLRALLAAVSPAPDTTL